MGKKKIKKNLAKKTINNNVGANEGSASFLKKFGITLGSVLVIMSLIFVILNTFMEKPEEETPIDYTENLGYNKILAQDTFDMPSEEYVVFFINGEEGKDEVNEYYTALSEGKASTKLYVVDMAEEMNATHRVDDTKHLEQYGDFKEVEYNKEPTSSSEVEIYEYPTVIHISGGQMLGYYVGDEFYEPFGLENPNAQTQQQY